MKQNNILICNGINAHGSHEREELDYYATEPRAVELLCDLEVFNRHILEPACGEGHISKVLSYRGYEVESYDIVDRGYGIGGIDFLSRTEKFKGDIITNPPFRYAKEFVEHSLSLVEYGAKIAFFLKLQFLEGKSRRKMFDNTPPVRVWVSSSRLQCALNGQFRSSSPTSYAWFVWIKGCVQNPEIKWFN